MPKVGYITVVKQIPVVVLSDSDDDDDLLLLTQVDPPNVGISDPPATIKRESVADHDDEPETSDVKRESVADHDDAPEASAPSNEATKEGVAEATSRAPIPDSKWWESLRFQRVQPHDEMECPKINRLIKLVRVSRDGGATEAERIVALHLVEKQLWEMHMTESELEAHSARAKSEVGTSVAIVTHSKEKPCADSVIKLMRGYAMCCADIFAVKAYRTIKHSRWSFVGLLANAKLAAEAFCGLAGDETQRTAKIRPTISTESEASKQSLGAMTRNYRNTVFDAAGHELRRLTKQRAKARDEWTDKYRALRTVHLPDVIGQAVRGYANFYERDVKSVDPLDVSNSSSGILGWCTYYTALEDGDGNGEFGDDVDSSDSGDSYDSDDDLTAAACSSSSSSDVKTETSEKAKKANLLAIACAEQRFALSCRAEDAATTAMSSFKLRKPRASKRKFDADAYEDGKTHAKSIPLPALPALGCA